MTVSCIHDMYSGCFWNHVAFSLKRMTEFGSYGKILSQCKKIKLSAMEIL